MREIKTKGITLISLVITIVVLLILAGVAISISVDEDGLFSKSEKAKNDWNANVVKEELSVGEVLDQLDNAKPTEVTVSSDSFPEGWNTDEIEAVATADHRQAPIPEGFVASQVEGENTIAGGLVIYRKENGIMEVTEANHPEALTNCDQYVWIPVADINDMVMCKSNSAGSVCNLVQEENGDLKCTTHNSKDLAGRLYEGKKSYVQEDGKYIFTVKMDYTKKDQTYVADTGTREPANLPEGDYDWYGGEKAGADGSENGILAIKGILEEAEQKTYTGTVTYDTIKDDWLALQQSDFDKMAKSVAKYKGFYISRYEAGTNGASKKGQTIITAGTNNQMWYGLFSELRSENTGMLWGCQSDQVMKFIGAEAEVGHTDRNLTTIQTEAGINVLDKMKNIYDLQGHLREFTMAAKSAEDNHDYRICRGSYRSNTNAGQFEPAAVVSSGTPMFMRKTESSRVTFFINL